MVARHMLLWLAGSTLLRFVRSQHTGVGPVVPNTTYASGPEQRSITAAQMLLAQRSNNFLGVAVRKNVTFCMDNDPITCPLGHRVTVACRGGSEVFVIFNATTVPQGSILPDPALLLSGVYEDQCSFTPLSACQPAMNQYVIGNFTNVQEDIEVAVRECDVRDPVLITCTGQSDTGGATAAMCGYWASQAFPASSISVVTFQSNWSATMVNCAFVARYGRFVPYTIDVQRSAENLLNSMGVVSSPPWISNGADCNSSPYCKVNEGVNASCSLLQDINSQTQFLQEYPGAVVLYAPNTAAIPGADVLMQSAAIMWVPESSALVMVFANNVDTARTLDPNDYVGMESLWNAEALAIDPQAFEPYTTSFRAADAPDIPGQFDSANPMVVSTYMQQFAQFQSINGSKQQCTGLTGCYEYVSASGTPKLVVCAGFGVAGGLAGVCAAWAALSFPQAKVTWINAGSPQPVGNTDFYNFVYAATGNFYTLVNHLDPVPRSVLCLQNATSMEIPSVATYYVNQTGMTQPQDPFFSQVNCGYFNLPPSQRPASPDSECSSYFSEAIEAAISVPIQLAPQGAFASLPPDANMEQIFWQNPPLALYGA